MIRITDIPALPDRPEHGHKGLFGRLLVVGGSTEMIGAPILAAKAALRMGSGLVRVALPKLVLGHGLSICPELTGLALSDRPEHLSARTPLAAAIQQADTIVVGPGMGTSPRARQRLMKLLASDRPIVVDADALNLLALLRTWPHTFRAPAVLTPHPGEMKRLGNLFGTSDIPATDFHQLDATHPDANDADEKRIAIARQAAQISGQIILLKGARTIVVEPSTNLRDARLYINQTGNSSLSKAGTGDVLAGMIASLIGQGMPRFEAACLAAHLHGLAGQHAGERLGQRSVLASDVIDALPTVIRQHQSHKSPPSIPPSTSKTLRKH
jgi:NAD(P)H-hydrate epimerase